MEQALLMVCKPTVLFAASLLLSGVMLTSCSVVSKEPEANTLTAQETSFFEKTDTRLTEIQTALEDLDQRVSAIEDLKHKIIARESLEHRISALENLGLGPMGHGNPVKSEKKEPQPLYIEPNLLYNKARSLLLEEDFHGAAQMFKEFVTQYPTSELADNALYWLGECHYSLGNFQQAIQTFKEVVALYPRGGKVPDALLKTAYAYLSLDDSDRAHHYLKLVVKGYPFTPTGEKAEQKLKAFH